MNNGIIYRGPSLYDGAPIVVVGLWSKRNRKTGGMLQTYIIRDDIHPMEASKTGADASICGDCIHRGVPTDDPDRKQAKGRTCYVNLGQGVLVVWKSLQRDYYPGAFSRKARAALGAGRMVRIGTYGDPACVPAYVWNALLSEADGWTAYSHKSGWRPDIAMQSADTLAQAKEFWAAGSRVTTPTATWTTLRGSWMPARSLPPTSRTAGIPITACSGKISNAWRRRGWRMVPSCGW